MTLLSSRLACLAMAATGFLTVPQTGSANPAAPAAAAAPETEPSSRLDAPLFYQLLIGELELRQGDPATAYAVLLDAARRTREEPLFERAVEIALRAQAGNEALAAATAWRTAHPRSLNAVQAQARILLALNRLQALVEPLRTLIDLTPAAERAGAIASLPRLFRGHPDTRQTLQVLQGVLMPLADTPALRTPVQLALARALLQAGESPAALALAQDVARRQPSAPGPALLALEMAAEEPRAESLVKDYLEQPQAEPLVRLSYAQWLLSRQHHQPALAQLRQVVAALPDLAQAWFNLGAAALEAHESREAEQALQRYLTLTESARVAAPREGSEGFEDRTPSAARLMLSQLATDRGDFEAARKWLEPLDSAAMRLDVQTRRALILARQGRVEQARALVRAVPEQGAADATRKALAEAQVLRSVERWRDARTVLAQALERAPQDTDLLYELSLVLERLGRHEEMERQLRRIIELKPDHHHAHNALGYSLAERGIRLEEAHQLVSRALELAPADPFITDSLAWVAFRQGKLDRALELLRQAYQARPDVEIGAHLGEVLWASGEREEARRIWRQARQRDAKNRVLLETLQRLKVEP